MVKSETIYLNRNEYFFNHHPNVIRALQFPYEEATISQYAKAAEIEKLQDLIAESYNVNKNFVFLGHGAEDIFVKLLSWFRKEINSVVLEDFSWTNYLHIAEGFQYKVCAVPTLEEEQSFQFNYLAFEEKLRNVEPSIVFITSPNNPTGHILEQQQLFSLVSCFTNHLFIVDSVYNNISKLDFSNLFKLNNFIFVGSFSKFFGLPGLRLGYAIGNLPKAFHLNLGLQPNALKAALTAFQNIEYYQQNRDYMISFANGLLSDEFKNFKIYKTSAPFFLAKATNKNFDFKSAEHYSKIIPKYITKETEIFIRFGLGPKIICDRVIHYLKYDKTLA